MSVGEVREGVRGVGKYERVWVGVRGGYRDVLGECRGEVLGECGEMSRLSVESVGKV